MVIKKIACVSMVFPAPSETFHSNNVKALAETGREVLVYSLLPKHRDHRAMIEDRGLGNVSINPATLRNYLYGMGTALAHPALFCSLIGFVVKNTRGIHLLKSLVLMPGAFSIWSKIAREKPELVDLLWGHYPVLVGYLVKKTLPGTILAMGLLAYDLEMNYGGSRAAASLVDLVWTQATFNISQIRSAGFEKHRVKVIYDGLDLGKIIGKGPRIAGRIITIGRLISSKGIDLCIKAFSLAAKDWSDSQLVVLGEGPELANLKTLASRLGVSERVHFKGHLNVNEVAEELASSEVFLFMSHKPGERLPNVVKEAMANNVVSVVSRTPGIEELVKDKETGFILENNTPEEAAGVIGMIFRDPGRFDLMRKKASAFIEENFDCRREMAKLVSECELILIIKRGSP